MMPLLFTARCSNGPRPIKATTPPQHSWTVATIRDMVAGDAPNVKDCIILRPRLSCPVLWSSSGALRGALPAWGPGVGWGNDEDHHLDGTTCAPAGFPNYNSGRLMSYLNVLHDEQVLRSSGSNGDTIKDDGEAQPMSSGTDEDEDRGTCASSPSVSFIGRRRRHSCVWHRVWTPLPHFPGLGHGMNPIPYPPQLNFPPPPIVSPFLWGFPLLHTLCLLHPLSPH